MSLSDTQIERYSRQIVLPEVGGRGQEALLSSRVSIVGAGALAESLLAYLAGAGIGHVDLRAGADEDESALATLAERIESINPDVQVTIGATDSTPPGDDVSYDWWCEVSGLAQSARALAEAARVARVPAILAGASGSIGWMSIGTESIADSGCVYCGWLEASFPDARDPSSPLAPTVVGTIAALLSSCILDARLGLRVGRAAEWLRYDAENVTLARYPTTAREDCPVCAGHAGEKACHPTQDS